MPVEKMWWHEGAIERVGVVSDGDGFALQPRPCFDQQLLALAQMQPVSSDHYHSELHPQQCAFVRTLAQRLVRGAMIWVDYGYDARQYYHPQRDGGTVLGHYRQHVWNDVLAHPGLLDLSAHVNFTAIADAACEQGLELVGYTTQAHFLINLGLLEQLEALYGDDTVAYAKSASACQMLLSPQQMGERFKVIAMARGVDVSWSGFRAGSLVHRL